MLFKLSTCFNSFEICLLRVILSSIFNFPSPYLGLQGSIETKARVVSRYFETPLVYQLM